MISGLFAKSVAVIHLEGSALNGAKKCRAVEKAINRAEEDGVEAVIFRINIYDGLNWDSIQLALKHIGNAPLKTYALIDPVALRGGAMIAGACDDIYMTPAAIVGNLSPLGGTKERKQKSISFDSAVLSGLAEKKGHNVDLFRGFANPKFKVVVDDVKISTGKPLVLTSTDAERVFSDKPLLARGIVENVKALAEAAGLEGTLKDYHGRSGDWKKRLEEDPRVERMKTREDSFEGKIVRVPVGKMDLINPARFDFMSRMLMRAEVEGASAVILDIDSPGGLGQHTGELMLEYIVKMKTPTIAFVNPAAASAGALISCAAESIYMAPVSSIGSAAVITAGDQEIPKDVRRSINAEYRARVRAVCQARGHRADIGEAFVERKVAVIIGKGKDELVISKKGSLLAMNQKEATQEVEGKPVFAKGIAEDLEDLIAKEGFQGELVTAEPIGFEKVAILITKVAPLLLTIALFAGYMELRTSGFGALGLTALLIFAVIFFGHFVAGRLVGFEFVALFIIGIVLLLLEVFVFPGTLVSAMLGILCIMVSLFYTFAVPGVSPSGEISDFNIDMKSAGQAAMTMVWGIGGGIVLIGLLARFLPDTRAASWMVLNGSVAEGDGLEMGGSAATEKTASALVGQKGIAKTPLHPGGKALIGNRVIDVIADSEYIDAENSVEVVSHEGAHIVVKQG